MSVTVPAGATVTVAGATPIVPVSKSVAIASGPLPTQFIATGLKSANQTLQPAPGTSLTLLQVMPSRLAALKLSKPFLRYGKPLPFNSFDIILLLTGHHKHPNTTSSDSPSDKISIYNFYCM